MGKKNKKYDKPMPIRWQLILDLMPRHNWQIRPAALAVGYKPRYCESRLLRQLRNDARFCKALEVRKAELKAKYGIETGRLIRGWLTTAESNIADFIELDEGGNTRFKSLASLPRAILAAVESIKITERTERKKGQVIYTTTKTDFKLESRQAARESLGKIAGVFEADNDQKRNQEFNLNIVRFNLNGNSNNRKLIDSHLSE